MITIYIATNVIFNDIQLNTYKKMAKAKQKATNGYVK